MKTPVRLMKHAVLAMHAECLHAEGGSGFVRDKGLLASALLRPQHVFTDEKAD